MVETAVRALSCCCVASDDADSNQITYPVNLGFEEGHAQPLNLPPSNAGQFLRPGGGGLGRPDDLEYDFMSTSTRAAASNAPKTLSPEDRQREKERLQEMVKEFAKAVVQGLPCQWLPESTGAPRAALYSFDKALRHFTLSPEDAPPLIMDMGRISEISKEVRGGPFEDRLRYLPTPVAPGDDFVRRFACVEHEGLGRTEFVAILLPNQHERERFYTCMKILRW
eukprot:CAMPEP_0194749488 /NCGR_PEP_ID=MMETSP0323_2-20130528/3659_1 /TAXON_ID=2866 ORGANISM="Crypthecodinium cohnii, Strain Seligo" /NCGR_SAMPLE_ID=MMETSP0323_2 /ASSEMBLY_ACC=CAM_ASM_000346 /LENGTH=223 /DNA_ID=CAMNT_0039664601 /DNA_START=140 /DNA_END=808 /DNA_ORIENTATION=-